VCETARVRCSRPFLFLQETLSATDGGTWAMKMRAVVVGCPTWSVAWHVETLWRNESPFELPSKSAEVLAARALVLDETSLSRYVDVSWCSADLFYLQKLLFCAEATNTVAWKDVRK
jgi:hypothetical protein